MSLSVLGSTRPGRHGEQVARWVIDQAKPRTDAEFELVNLADDPASADLTAEFRRRVAARDVHVLPRNVHMRE